VLLVTNVIVSGLSSLT